MDGADGKLQEQRDHDGAVVKDVAPGSGCHAKERDEQRRQRAEKGSAHDDAEGEPDLDDRAIEMDRKLPVEPPDRPVDREALAGDQIVLASEGCVLREPRLQARISFQHAQRRCTLGHGLADARNGRGGAQHETCHDERNNVRHAHRGLPREHHHEHGQNRGGPD